MTEPTEPNVPVTNLDCEDCYMRSDGIQVAALGVRDLIIVASGNRLLVLPGGRSHEVKRLLAQMELDASQNQGVSTNETSYDATPDRGPPLAAVKLLSLVCSAETQEALIGDLEERFHQLKDRHGFKFAKFWFWWQAIRSFGFLVYSASRRLFELQALFRGIF